MEGSGVEPRPQKHFGAFFRCENVSDCGSSHHFSIEKNYRGVATWGKSVYIPLPPNQSTLNFVMWLFCLLDPGQIHLYPPKSNSWLRPWRISVKIVAVAKYYRAKRYTSAPVVPRVYWGFFPLSLWSRRHNELTALLYYGELTHSAVIIYDIQLYTDQADLDDTTTRTLC